MPAFLPLLLALLGSTLLGSTQAYAQLQDGALAPELPSAKWLHASKRYSLEDLHGRPVMLVIWDRIDAESMADGPPMGSWWRSEDEPGALMLSVTSQSAEEVKPYLEKHDVRFPVATSCRADELYAVTGQSYIFLIGWDGRITGSSSRASKHVRQLASEAHEEARDHSHIWDPRPLPPGVDLDQFLKYCLEGKMSKAEKALEKALDRLDDDEEEAIADVGGLMLYMFFRPAGRVKYIRSLAEEQGRAYEASLLAKDSAAVFKGTVVDDSFHDLAKELKKEHKKVYALDKKRVAAMDKAFEGDREGALAGLRELVEKVKGTSLEAFLEKEIRLVESMGVLAPETD